MDDCIRKLKTHRYLKNRKCIAWEPVYWADILNPRQEDYLSEARQKHEMDFMGIRRFVVSALGDAAAYRWPAKAGKGLIDLNNPSCTYEKIHKRVYEGMENLRRNVDCHANLVVLAHSLGGHIMSNYIWDIQQKNICKGTMRKLSKFEKIETLRLIVTFGCPIPLFTFALNKNDIEPICLPEGAMWRNFYDRDDVFGYPLEPINCHYKKTVKDKEINVGGLLSSWNPLSHFKYWTDQDFIRPVAKAIGKIQTCL